MNEPQHERDDAYRYDRVANPDGAPDPYDDKDEPIILGSPDDPVRPEMNSTDAAYHEPASPDDRIANNWKPEDAGSGNGKSMGEHPARPSDEVTLPLPGMAEPLFEKSTVARYQDRWKEVQAKFVDEPLDAVQQADALVQEVVGQMTQALATEHNALSVQWRSDNHVSTEELRQVMQRYRGFLNRLVA